MTKLPNSEQSYKGKVKYVYKQTKSVNNRKTVKTAMTLFGTGLSKKMVG
jgi:hypothetical protein